MKKTTQILLLIFFIALVVEIVIISPKLVDETEIQGSQTGIVEEEKESVEQLLTGIHLVESDKEVKEWELWSEEARAYKKKKFWNLKKVKVKFFGDKGVVFLVTGNSGRVEIKTKNLEIRGSVLTKTSNGYEYKTEVVNYNSKDKLLVSKEAIEMLGPKDSNEQRMFLKGKNLEANLESSMIEIKNDVNAERVLHTNKKIFIKSQRAQFSGASQYARFLDNVVIDYDTMRLTGPDATFNYDSDKDFVSSLNVQGGVKVSDLDKWATSQMVDVEFDKEKYIFKGAPRVVQNNDELKGEEIIFYDGGKKVKIKKARANLNDKSEEVLK